MIEPINVTQAKALDGHRLHLTFSDGRQGVRDCSDILADGGPMVEPLRSPEMFKRVFVSMGVPTWPNGFDLDAVRLYQEMFAVGEIQRAAANAAE